MRRKPYLLQKVITIQLPQPYEELFSSPIDVPTTSQQALEFSKTLSESDLAKADVGDNFLVRIFRYIIVIYNPSSSSGTLYYTMLRNGVSISSGDIYVTANGYNTYSFNFTGVKPGDTIVVRFYGSISGLKWLWHGWCSTASRLLVFKNKVLEYIRLISTKYPNFSLGKPYPYDEPLSFYHIDLKYHSTSATDFTLRGWEYDPNYGLYNVYSGDFLGSNTAFGMNSGSYYPYYTRDLVPIKIVLRAYRL